MLALRLELILSLRLTLVLSLSTRAEDTPTPIPTPSPVASLLLLALALPPLPPLVNTFLLVYLLHSQLRFQRHDPAVPASYKRCKQISKTLLLFPLVTSVPFCLTAFVIVRFPAFVHYLWAPTI